jgi:hypothetical protein
MHSQTLSQYAYVVSAFQDHPNTTQFLNGKQISAEQVWRFTVTKFALLMMDLASQASLRFPHHSW